MRLKLRRLVINWLLHCFCEILDSAQKLPGGHACAARRHISVGPVLGVFCLSCFAVGGIPPGGSYDCCCFTCFLEFSRVLGVPLGKLLYGNVNYA